MKKTKSSASHSGHPSSVIQLGVVFVVVAAIVLLAVAVKLYTY